MISKICFVILFIIFILLVVLNTEHSMLVEVKQKYSDILAMLRATGDPMWLPVLSPALITGMVGWSKEQGPIGSNVNKGYEIYLCLDGNDVNSVVYVLIHELAHMTVSEYDHTSSFWTNFAKLKELCVQNGIYTMQGTRQYCGDTIRDNEVVTASPGTAS